MKLMRTMPPPRQWHPHVWAVIEVTLISMLFFVFAGSPPPGDDEAHYLGKAKHYFNPDWLAGDFFLSTPDAHQTFNWTIGWLTLFFSLTTVAWIGRITAWVLLAWAWRRLSFAIIPHFMGSLLSVGLFLVFQEHGNVAREWIVRGVEAKCFAYVFVLLGIEAIVRSRWCRVWPLLGIASALHVLVGGWAVVAAGIAWMMTKDRLAMKTMWPWLMVGGLMSLPGLVPGLLLTRGIDAEIVREASYTYVFERLSHHLLAHEFGWPRVIRFHGMIAAWAWICWLTRGETSGAGLRRFVGASLMIAVVGVGIDQSTLYYPDLAATLLRYYWYRLADVMVPVGLAVAIVELLVLRSTAKAWQRAAPLAWCVTALIPMIVLSTQTYRSWQDPRSGADAQGQISKEQFPHWLNVCDWVQANTPVDAIFLTPPNTTTFRWHAQRSEVVSWKDIPQDAVGIVEWRKRLAATRRFWASIQSRLSIPTSGELLADLVTRYNVSYVIVDNTRYPQFDANEFNVKPVRKLYPPSWDGEAVYSVYTVLDQGPQSLQVSPATAVTPPSDKLTE